MHPYATDSDIGALAYDALRGLGFRDDDHTVDAARDRSQVGITAMAFEARHVRIDREDVVPGLL
jgi:hypothetical protein